VYWNDENEFIVLNIGINLKLCVGGKMKLVIFDLDGVIVSTDMYHYMAWKSLADENNLIFSYEINHMLRGVSRAESLKIILEVNGKVVMPQEFLEMMEKKNNIYREKLEELKREEILPGALELIKDLKKNNIKVAIGSSSKNAALILEKIGLKEEFDVVIDGNKISNSKPHPEVFLKCSESLSIDPKDCVVFEDAKAGIEAALAGGMVAIGVGEEHFKNAHAMVESLYVVTYKQIFEIYKKINN